MGRREISFSPRNTPCQPSYISVSGIVNSPAACLRSSKDFGRSSGMARGLLSKPLSLPVSPGSMVGGGAGPESLAHGTSRRLLHLADAVATDELLARIRYRGRIRSHCWFSRAKGVPGVACEVSWTRERSTYPTHFQLLVAVLGLTLLAGSSSGNDSIPGDGPCAHRLATCWKQS